VCPAQLGDALTERAQTLALDVFGLLGCRGFARVDLMLEEETGELYVLEVNAIPGLTDTSLLPQAAEAAGIEFDELISRIVEMALQPA
jgi:D-alanine-D-alanine ligase